MKTYKETENYRMLVNLTYTIFNFVALYQIFDWELVKFILKLNYRLVDLVHISILLGDLSNI